MRTQVQPQGTMFHKRSRAKRCSVGTLRGLVELATLNMALHNITNTLFILLWPFYNGLRRLKHHLEAESEPLYVMVFFFVFSFHDRIYLLAKFFNFSGGPMGFSGPPGGQSASSNPSPRAVLGISGGGYQWDRKRHSGGTYIPPSVWARGVSGSGSGGLEGYIDTPCRLSHCYRE